MVTVLPCSENLRTLKRFTCAGGSQTAPGSASGMILSLSIWNAWDQIIPNLPVSYVGRSKLYSNLIVFKVQKTARSPKMLRAAKTA